MSRNDFNDMMKRLFWESNNEILLNSNIEPAVLVKKLKNIAQRVTNIIGSIVPHVMKIEGEEIEGLKRGQLQILILDTEKKWKEFEGSFEDSKKSFISLNEKIPKEASSGEIKKFASNLERHIEKSMNLLGDLSLTLNNVLKK